MRCLHGGLRSPIDTTATKWSRRNHRHARRLWSAQRGRRGAVKKSPTRSLLTPLMKTPAQLAGMQVSPRFAARTRGAVFCR